MTITQTPRSKTSKQPLNAVRQRAAPTPLELYSAKGVLNLGTNVGPDQHQFTDSLYGTVGSGSLEKTVVVDGVGSPYELDANGESSYTCVYPWCGRQRGKSLVATNQELF